MGTTSLARRGGVIARFLRGFNADEHNTSFVDHVEFEFLDDVGAGSGSDDGFGPNDEMVLELDDEDHHDGEGRAEEDQSFWDNQLQLLQNNLCRTSSVESRIRNATKEAVHEIYNSETKCGCCNRQLAASSCRSCFMREVSRRLQKSGYNSAICQTKWKNSSVPSGEHTFLDVIERSSKDTADVRVIIELNFRAEFEMARASEGYNRLVRRLPEVYVGKAERLSNVIKILCMAAKRCTKENKMHMGPWRKLRYMEAKWLGPCKRNTSTTSLSTMMQGYYSEGIIPKQKPKASMLTVDLLEKLPNMHYKAVEVV